ncbi:hypothetical protein [Blautia sp. OF11-22]|uniref:hypothetical protein n=1 Tax=Blautia sp. OF11-22 TaxID=2292982 RepID=UPI000E5C9829|nr:hypothetical protein [Blautia sp. OF11-22]RHV75691.1 hypothetical protein DXB02_16845 [Blautia sp. OF11-22]
MWKKIKSAQEQKNTFRIKKELWIPVFVLMIGLVVLVNIGIRADSSQRDLIRSRAELNAVTYADHMKADIVRGIDITNTFEQIVISENGKISMFSKVAENMIAYSARTAHPFQRNGAPFRFKLSKAQQVD